MGLESGTYISDFVATNPTIADKRRKGDDHFRWMKSAILATFPNITGALTPTHTELNFVTDVTSAIQTQLDAKLTIADAEGDGLIIVEGEEEEDPDLLTVGAGLGIAVNADDVQVDISGLDAIEGNALVPADDGSLIDDDGVPKRMAFTDDGIVIVADTGLTRVLATADCNTYIERNNASANTITVNTGFGKKGNVIMIEQFGVGQVTIDGTATVNAPIGKKTRARYSTVVLICKGSNVWTLSGDAEV